MAWRKLKSRRRARRNPPLDSRAFSERELPPFEPAGDSPLREQVADYSDDLRLRWVHRPMSTRQVKKYLHKTIPEVGGHFEGLLIGSGARGSVYDVMYPVDGKMQNRVVKITEDADEAAAAKIIMSAGNTNGVFPVIDGVYLHEKGHYLIFREDIKHKFFGGKSEPAKVFSDVVTDFFLAEFPGEAQYASEVQIAWFVWAEGNGSPYAPVVFPVIEDVNEDLKIELFAAGVGHMWQEYLHGLARAREELGIRFLDLHEDNLRLRKLPWGDYEIVVSDLGFAAVTQATRIPVVNPRR